MAASSDQGQGVACTDGRGDVQPEGQPQGQRPPGQGLLTLFAPWSILTEAQPHWERLDVDVPWPALWERQDGPLVGEGGEVRRATTSGPVHLRLVLCT